MAVQYTSAQNPFVQTWCTSDPAPMVWNDKLVQKPVEANIGQNG